MREIMSLLESMDETQKSIIILVVIVVAGVALAIYLWTRPDKTTDY